LFNPVINHTLWAAVRHHSSGQQTGTQAKMKEMGGGSGGAIDRVASTVINTPFTI
jgi:hypothetical protein